ncbi:MAG: hypothetical protein N3D82_05555 [Ignisphaera sp.]|nr:hypothetical protein [Ignisphaera sp.]MCX8168471.1 hypothetical protein [Ignisphaera sp.]MDW8085089.1 hypothetical protein [Ignisphaera sp.]
MYEEEPTITEEVSGKQQVEEEVEEVEHIELSPLELEFFITRGEIWDRLVRNEIDAGEARRLLDNLYSSLISQSKSSLAVKRGRRASKSSR